MIVTPVDPRDQKWEGDSPGFRVCFWERLGQGGYRSDEYEIRGSDVVEVLRWAEEAKGERSFTVYLCVIDEAGLGVVLLAGTDPTVS